LRVGIIGTGAIAAKHAAAYRNIGFQIRACTNYTTAKGVAFAEAHGAEYVGSVEELCRHPRVDYVDVCTFPNYRLPVVELCVAAGKHVLVQKPIAVDLATADRMIAIAANAGIQLGVVGQHRFHDATLFLKRAIAEGRLGRIFQADAYVKWFRSTEY
jgi:predicted dehydrogenase